MKNEKIVLQLSTTENRKEKLKIIAKEQGYTISGIVNRLIDEYLKKNKVEQWHLKKLKKNIRFICTKIK